MKGAPIKLATIVEEMRFKKVIKESLTKKDFYAMARYIKNAPSQHRDVLMDFAIEISKADNPRFDEARFRKAVLGETTVLGQGMNKAGKAADEEMRFKKVIKESLTKKDFYAMARYIKNAPSQHRDVLMDFAIEISKADNPRFDEARFRKAVLGETTVLGQGMNKAGKAADIEQSDREYILQKKRREERDKADYEREVDRANAGMTPKNEATKDFVWPNIVWEKVRKPGEVWDSVRSTADADGPGDKSHVKLGAKNHKGVIRYFDRKDRKKAEAFART